MDGTFESFLFTSNLAVAGLKVCIRQTVWLCVHHNPPGQPEPRHAQVQELRPPGPDPPPLLVLGEGGRQLQPPGLDPGRGGGQLACVMYRVSAGLCNVQGVNLLIICYWPGYRLPL